MVTAKITCTSKIDSGEGDQKQTVVTFQPDYADDRNREWSLYTPALGLTMTLKGLVADRFKVSGKYTLVFEEEESNVGDSTA